jgi:hypothetical protein
MSRSASTVAFVIALNIASGGIFLGMAHHPQFPATLSRAIRRQSRQGKMFALTSPGNLVSIGQ